MKNFIKTLLVVAVLSLSLATYGQSDKKINQRSSTLDRMYFGGGLGLSFGTITLINISPLVGYRITNEWSAGVQVQYQYRSYNNFTPSITGSDYGVTLFTRYTISQPFFLHAEYEHLNYEYVFVRKRKSERFGFNSFFIGGGVNQPMGANSSFTILVLYNLSYDETKVPRPYFSPLKFNVGFNFGL